MFTGVLFIPKVETIGKWIHKLLYMYLYNGIHLSHEKGWATNTCNNIDKSEQHDGEWKSRDQNITYCRILFVWHIIYCRILFVWHSQKDKTIMTDNKSGIRDGEGVITKRQSEGLGGRELLSCILSVNFTVC